MIISFSIHYNTIWGQKLCITGSIPELGNWNPNQAPEMTYSPGGSWYLKLHLPESQNTFFKYKYCIIDENKNSIEWEPGKNRIFISNIYTSENVPLDDSWQADNDIDNTGHMWKGAGVAIPVFSIRSKNGMGVGEFTDIKLIVDWAKNTGLKMIQILPVNDTISTKTGADSSPYSTISVFALHPIYLSIIDLYKFYKRKIEKPFYEAQHRLNKKTTLDYEAVLNEKLYHIKKIFDEQKGNFISDTRYKDFFTENKSWIVPYAAFSYLRDYYKTCDYSTWENQKYLSLSDLEKFTSPGSPIFNEISFYYFIQYHLHIQLSDAAQYARKNKIILKGDIPIGVNRFSADTWTNPDFFNMNSQTGAPPDDFSQEGQNWQFPTYNWEKMEKDGYKWWQDRLKQMSLYFDAFRIDHILGFFRIWEIPADQIQGVMGHFNPSLPLNLDDFNKAGLKIDFQRFCRPYIRQNMLFPIFGTYTKYAARTFLKEYKPGYYKLKPLFQTQGQVEEYFSVLDNVSSYIHPINKNKIKNGLFKLISEVLFLKSNKPGKESFHPRIDMLKTNSYKNLDKQTRLILEELYIDYFYKRHEEFWGSQGLKKLPVMKNATTMLVCGEDLGMVPDCVPDVMEELGILSLNIQRMPKKLNETFNNPAANPYLSVCTTSSHDMPPVRAWWEQEERERIQMFYNTILKRKGKAPDSCTPEICRQIIKQHLDSPSMWAVFPIQDILAMSKTLKRKNSKEEQINNPANPGQIWNYRFHMNIEDLIEESGFNRELLELIETSGRYI